MRFYLAAFVLIATLISVRADTFIEGKFKVDVPAGWFTYTENSHLKNDPILNAVYVTREKIDVPSGVFKTGLTAVRYDGSSMTEKFIPSLLIAKRFKRVQDSGIVLDSRSSKYDHDGTYTIDFITRDRNTETMTKSHFEAFDKTGIAWMVVIECPSADFQANNDLFDTIAKSISLSGN